MKLQIARSVSDGEVKETYRLLQLYRDARDGGRNPEPGFKLYQIGTEEGFEQAFSIINEIVNPTYLSKHINPQYTFGYYDGVVRALHEWTGRLEADRLVPAVRQS